MKFDLVIRMFTKMTFSRKVDYQAPSREQLNSFSAPAGSQRAMCEMRLFLGWLPSS
jgi:hypothetical protein